MENKMIKFISSTNEEIEYLNFFNSISVNSSPFQQLLNGEDLNDCFVVISSHDEYKIPLNEVTKVSINMKGVGSFYFFFLSKFFDINQTLIDLSLVNRKENTREKIEYLFEVLKAKNVLFVIYIPCQNPELDIKQINYQESLFYVEDQQIEEVKTAPEVKEEVAKDTVKEEKAVEETKKEIAEQPKKEKKSFSVKDFFSPILTDVTSLLFIAVASIMIFFTIAVGIYSYKDNNNLFLLFFAFTAAGFVFNFIIFKDYAKKQLKKYNEYIFVILFAVIGLLISLGLFSLYYSYITNGKEEIPIAKNKVILIASLIYLTIEIICIVLGKLINSKRKS